MPRKAPKVPTLEGHYGGHPTQVGLTLPANYRKYLEARLELEGCEDSVGTLMKKVLVEKYPAPSSPEEEERILTDLREKKEAELERERQRARRERLMQEAQEQTEEEESED